jgi:hypothetical protein
MKMFKLSLAALIAVLAIGESQAMARFFGWTASQARTAVRPARQLAKRSYAIDSKDNQGTEDSVAPKRAPSSAPGADSDVDIKRVLAGGLDGNAKGGIMRLLLNLITTTPIVFEIQRNGQKLNPTQQKLGRDRIASQARHYKDVKGFMMFGQPGMFEAAHGRMVDDLLGKGFSETEAVVKLDGMTMTVGKDGIKMFNVEKAIIDFRDATFASSSEDKK